MQAKEKSMHLLDDLSLLVPLCSLLVHLQPADLQEEGAT